MTKKTTMMAGIMEDDDTPIEKHRLNIGQLPNTKNGTSPFNILWMLQLFQRSHICTDPNPKVGSNNTHKILFRAIIMNNSALNQDL